MDNPLEQSIETSCIDKVAFQMIFVIQLQLCLQMQLAYIGLPILTVRNPNPYETR